MALQDLLQPWPVALFDLRLWGNYDQTLAVGSIGNGLVGRVGAVQHIPRSVHVR